MGTPPSRNWRIARRVHKGEAGSSGRCEFAAWKERGECAFDPLAGRAGGLKPSLAEPEWLRILLIWIAVTIAWFAV